MISRVLPPLAAFLLLVATVVPQPARGQEPAFYLALGDSLAFGQGTDSPSMEGYVALTEAGLRAGLFAESGLDVRNLAVPGATSSELLQPNGQLELALSEIEARGGADIISIDIGANDLLELGGSDSPCLDAPSSIACQDALGETLATLQRNLAETLGQLRQAAPEARIYVIDLYNPYSGVGGDVELIASIGVQQVNGVVQAAAADPALDAQFVSIHDAFEGRASQWIAGDGIHPNKDGYRVMAEILLAAIEGRQAVIPEDLRALPSPTPGPETADEGDSGVSVAVPAVGIPVAFLAGLVLSAAYFGMRGRR